jgi:hypothetical protein
MTYTGIFATKEEIEEARKLAKNASETPVIAFSSAHAMRGGLSGDAWQIAKEYCHEIAIKHGLKDFEGFYGMTEDGEFVKP